MDFQALYLQPFLFNGLAVFVVYRGNALEKAVTKTIEKVTSFINKEYPDKVLGTLFKNASICKEIYTQCI
jgi:cobalamin biosynthesis Co2+ chelatase CbiK